MAADLHIHVLEGVTEEDVATMNKNVLGSKYFDPTWDGNKPDDLYDRIFATPQIWIGEVSWLKASLLEDNERYIPATVMHVQETIGENLPTLDNELMKSILSAFEMHNGTIYSLADKVEVEEFLTKHMGKKLFTISW